MRPASKLAWVNSRHLKYAHPKQSGRSFKTGMIGTKRAAFKEWKEQQYSTINKGTH
jgi:hypothetical protein